MLFWKGGITESKKQYLKSLVYYEESLKLHLSVLGDDENTADIRVGDVSRIREQHDLAFQNFTLALNMYKYLVLKEMQNFLGTMQNDQNGC